jgi:hypothetical protein
VIIATLLLFLVTGLHASVIDEAERFINESFSSNSAADLPFYSSSQRDLVVKQYLIKLAKHFKTTFSEQVKANLQTKIKAKILSKGLSRVNHCNITVDGHEIPILKEDDLIVVRGVGFEPKKISTDCLQMEKIGKTLHLNYLYTSEQACPVPTEKSGIFLLKVVDRVARRLGVEKIKLVDASEVTCNTDEKSKTSLKILTMFKTGRSWYGVNGYTYSDPNYPNEEQNDGDHVRMYSISSILSDLKKRTKSELNSLLKTHLSRVKKGQKKLVEEYYESLPELTKKLEHLLKDYKDKLNLSANTNIALGDFFVWLWNRDCSVPYQQMFKLIFPDKAIAKYSEVTPSFFDEISKINMVKPLTRSAAQLNVPISASCCRVFSSADEAFQSECKQITGKRRGDFEDKENPIKRPKLVE